MLTVGGCFVAMGTKSYFYRDGRRVSNGVVYNNDSKVITVRDEEEAYEKIAENLGVKNIEAGVYTGKNVFTRCNVGKWVWETAV